MFKRILLKQMMKSQMKDVPEEQQEQMLNMIEKNPELFQKIAVETKSLVDNGLDQMSAAMKVAEKYKDELKKLN
ncbi:hypothetical protein COW81_01640 [Candidatus Campbellbacteria bacterium CG22_combo_CG10-13_8_21_14_all_36_13]|uniref:Plasmodium falciparum erythrocyte membrane protein-1 N-terminal segment domain-containing protein n=1 Tax=Candidatus Campbellbacteria bacterium CG22_combo_CG10-13_8_21_14_all_36_13 TaxID=1974529 RepID=A0A2H0DYC3_9BACT|nr:MAG: hypothetical protein COW81_01640 [Candidatus Campbellbacteria bacterium CG22_combo_CG10-13_8_21_14_all_36_13]